MVKALEIISKHPNLIELWESYKKISQNRIAATTIKLNFRVSKGHYSWRKILDKSRLA